MDSERRIFDRFTSRFPAKYKDTRGDFGQDVFLRNASASGAQFITRERIFYNDRVSLEVELPDGISPMVLNGRVVWSKPANAAMWEIGLQFDDVNFMKMQRLFKFSNAS